MRIKRKTKKQLIQRIIQLLEQSPRTMNELAVLLTSNWDTVRKNLELLKTINVVEDFDKEGQKYFKVAHKEPLSLREDTLFGIPISKENENLCKFLFRKIKEEWIKVKGVAPNKTEMQKAVVELSDKLSLNVPAGWYLFGKMCVLQYEPSVEYSSPDFKIDKLNPAVKEVVKDLTAHKYTEELMIKQYKKYKKAIYLIRLQLKKLFDYQFDDKTKNEIIKLSYFFLSKFNKKEDNLKIYEILEIYVSALNQIILKKKESEIEQIRDLLRESFVAVWELIAAYNLLDSLVEGNFGYDRNELWKYFYQRIDTLILICEDYLAELMNYCPKEEKIEDEFTKFKGTKKVKHLSEEERKKLFSEFEKKDTSDIFGKLNLN
jgi:hypothetical protein